MRVGQLIFLIHRPRNPPLGTYPETKVEHELPEQLESRSHPLFTDLRTERQRKHKNELNVIGSSHCSENCHRSAPTATLITSFDPVLEPGRCFTGVWELRIRRLVSAWAGFLLCPATETRDD
jgi:hypothetical protein